MNKLFLSLMSLLLLSGGNLFASDTQPVGKAETATAISGNPEVLSSTAPAQSPAELKGYVSTWSRVCRNGDCDIARPIHLNIPVTMSIQIPTQSGSFALGKFAQAFALLFGEEQDTLTARLTIMAVCPQTGKDSSCQGFYWQAQTQVEGAADAYCTASLNQNDAVPFPVMTCAGKSKKDGDIILGITLHRTPIGQQAQ